MPKLACGAHAGGPIGGFGGAPYVATKRYSGLVKMSHLGVWDVFGWSHWGFQWGSIGPTTCCTGW
eukprot:6994327-Pyramimonas_sp.AAC.1